MGGDLLDKELGSCGSRKRGWRFLRSCKTGSLVGDFRDTGSDFCMPKGPSPHRAGTEVRAESGLQRQDLWGQEEAEKGGRASICRLPFSPSLVPTVVSSGADQGLFQQQPDWGRGEQMARQQLPAAHHKRGRLEMVPRGGAQMRPPSVSPELGMLGDAPGTGSNGGLAVGQGT